jgi:hypothetical protein
MRHIWSVKCLCPVLDPLHSIPISRETLMLCFVYGGKKKRTRCLQLVQNNISKLSPVSLNLLGNQKLHKEIYKNNIKKRTQYIFFVQIKQKKSKHIPSSYFWYEYLLRSQTINLLSSADDANTVSWLGSHSTWNTSSL